LFVFVRCGIIRAISSEFESKKDAGAKVNARYRMMLTQFYVFLLLDAATRIHFA
jgi:hypothetical protein